MYQHDVTASLASWRGLLADAQAKRVTFAELAEVRARLGIARHLDTLALTDDAIEQLERVVALKPEAPFSSLALAQLRLGEAHDRLNARAEAQAAYRSAARLAPADDPLHIKRQAADGLRKAPNAHHAEAFRLSLHGWRAFERKDLASAATAFARSIELNPRDPVAHYRYGRLLEARRNDDGALAHFAIAIRDDRAAPAPITGEAYLESARIHERAGRRDEAIAAYGVASTFFGAANTTHAAAARALARLNK